MFRLLLTPLAAAALAVALAAPAEATYPGDNGRIAYGNFITGQIYTAVGNKIAVWNQPREVRSMYADGRWTPESIAAHLDSSIGQERMAILDALDAMRAAAASGAKPNA